MFAQVPLFPEQAATQAVQVDTIFFVLVAVTGAASLLVAVLVVSFAVRYRRRPGSQATPRILGSAKLEWFWTLVPLAFFLTMFFWGANVYNKAFRPPADALEVFVVGKQWMWKIQHAGGQREINQLHVPVGRAVKLTITSEDVIHDFAVPAFRLKRDAVPGRYTTAWFRAIKVGRYHLFCDQYCGTSHSTMIGTVVVMEPEEYADWRSRHADGSMAAQGRQLFLKLQCLSCHNREQPRAPLLENVYGSRVVLEDGRTVIADREYLRRSILYPARDVVQGWKPIMPTFKGQVDELELHQLIEFIHSLGTGETPVPTEDFPPPVGAPTKPEEKGGQR
jgi:cytochrome c oxidase subunit 2